MKNKIDKTKFLINISIIILFIHISSAVRCPNHTPLSKNNTCVEKCSREEVFSKICEIDVEHAKHFLSSIIVLGKKNNCNINIKSNKNNDMIIQIVFQLEMKDY